MGKNRLIVKTEEAMQAEPKPVITQQAASPKPSVHRNTNLKSKIVNIKYIVDGSYIRHYVLQNLLFIFYIVFITFLYITNTYYTLGTMRTIERTKNQIKELRYEYVSTKKNMIETSRRDKIMDRLNQSAKYLKESKVPPYKLTYNQ